MSDRALDRPLVLDASAILSGRPPSPDEAALRAPSTILDEVTEGGRDRRVLDRLRDAGLQLLDPTKEALVRVDAAARSTGDVGRLSTVDRDVLALALDLDATVVTDDYSIQNVAEVLEVPWRAVGQPGITEVRRWVHRCTGCRRLLDEPHDACPVCGSPVRTVPEGAGGRKR